MCAFVKSCNDTATLVVNLILDVGEFDPAVLNLNLVKFWWGFGARPPSSSPDKPGQSLKRIKIMLDDEIFAII
jgi:hypothetical protein